MGNFSFNNATLYRGDTVIREFHCPIQDILKLGDRIIVLLNYKLFEGSNNVICVDTSGNFIWQIERQIYGNVSKQLFE